MLKNDLHQDKENQNYRNEEQNTSRYNSNDSDVSKFFNKSNNSNRNSVLNNSNCYTSPKTKKKR